MSDRNALTLFMLTSNVPTECLQSLHVARVRQTFMHASEHRAQQIRRMFRDAVKIGFASPPGLVGVWQAAWEL